MLHTMPDKSVRVTSRFPDGHSAVFFDLEHGDGFTLERDCCQPGICTLRMLHGYRNFTARYGDPAEAAADFAELTTMLADRHCQLPSPSSSLPAQPPSASLPPSSSLGAGKRTGWGWKGMVAGLAIGAVAMHFATGWRTADSSAVRAAALGDAFPRPGARDDGDFIPDARRMIPPPPPASPLIPVAPAKSPLPSRPPSPAPSFGLQP